MVTAGSAYRFAPQVQSNLSYSFSISNKPSWASFSIATGALTGIPPSTALGTYANIVITASNAYHRASLAPFAIAVVAAPVPPAPPPANIAPVISGTPATGVLAGSAYAFTPVASDANGDTLSFSISGKPAWALFNTATGTLSGTPLAADVASYGPVVISVSDGMASTSLAPFTISVTAVASGTATLSWSPPTQNTDGSPLSDLAGYYIYYGSSAATLSNRLVVSNAGLTAYTLTSLASGTYYFAVSAYTTTGTESAQSNVGSKSVP